MFKYNGIHFEGKSVLLLWVMIGTDFFVCAFLFFSPLVHTAACFFFLPPWMAYTALACLLICISCDFTRKPHQCFSSVRKGLRKRVLLTLELGWCHMWSSTVSKCFKLMLKTLVFKGESYVLNLPDTPQRIFFSHAKSFLFFFPLCHEPLKHRLFCAHTTLNMNKHHPVWHGFHHQCHCMPCSNAHAQCALCICVHECVCVGLPCLSTVPVLSAFPNQSIS